MHYFFLIRSMEREFGELSEEEQAIIRANPWPLPEDVLQKIQGILIQQSREKKEREERVQRSRVERMFEDKRILEREKEMRELQKLFMEEQVPQLDQRAIKCCIELLQEVLRKLHEDSGTLCEFAVKARRLALVKLGLISPAEARNIRTVHEALPMNWPAKGGVEESGNQESAPGDEEGGDEQEGELFITQCSSQTLKGRKRKYSLSQQPNRQEKITKFFSSQK